MSMERMRSASEDVYKLLQDKDPKHWSLAFFTNTALCVMLCNNMCEAFKSAILNARDKLLISLMEMIRICLMKRLVRKIAELERWKHEISPKVLKLVEKVKFEGNICRPEYYGNHKYQVRGYGDEQYNVDIQNRTCAHNKWQLTGIPCIHGMSTLLNSINDPIQFVLNMYKKETFMKAYNPFIYGINGPTMWPNTNDKLVQVLEFKKQRRRPKKARNLQSDECSKCNQQGHNKTTCEIRKGLGSKTEPTDVAESTKPSQVTEATDAAESTQPSQVTEATQATEQAEPSQETQPSQGTKSKRTNQ
ncbi:hypothetical protein Ddye_022003 [Dipteronia dyeriana]|uniref:Zinc finger PMZ-type domain-containing protein n=1 Tax=Dipteronia dyeriana TaxID=168575 RepID=A0AAD9U3G0_9ROSI|nr:hypothetical protein Ddye_022003 [Dipteronia dyeriana]